MSSLNKFPPKNQILISNNVNVRDIKLWSPPSSPAAHSSLKSHPIPAKCPSNNNDCNKDHVENVFLRSHMKTNSAAKPLINGVPSCSTSSSSSSLSIHNYFYPSLYLPNQSDPLNHIALDIGGSLLKITWFDRSVNLGHANIGGKLSFISFPTDKVQDAIAFLKKLNSNRGLPKVSNLSNPTFIPLSSTSKPKLKPKPSPLNHEASYHIRATGGGAYRFKKLFHDSLGISLDKVDEMKALVSGLNFALRHVPMESYRYNWKLQIREYFENPTGTKPMVRTGFHHSPYYRPPSVPSVRSKSPQPNLQKHKFKQPQPELVETPDFFPYIFVNIGSGVSILKVDGWDSYQRVGGSSLGGGTYWGLCKLMTGIDSFEEMLRMSITGDTSTFDLKVGDIYGTSYSNIGLSSDTLASSFGKVMRTIDSNTDSNGNHSSPSSQSIPENTLEKKSAICKSLLNMLCYNIAQIAYLTARNFPKVKRIYFGGNFIADHEPTLHTLSFGLDYWSQGKMSAYFLVHGGYLGSIGTFIIDQSDSSKQATRLRTLSI